MKNKKRFFSLILCVGLMLGSLSGCGEGAGNTSSEMEVHTENVGSSNGVNNVEVQEEVEEEGALVLTEVITHKADGTSYTSEKYEYDEWGNEIDIKRYNSDGSCSYERKYVYQYDDKGNILKTEGFNLNGALVFEGEYDSAGNILKAYNYNSEGVLFLGVEKKYKTDGTITKSSTYDFGDEKWVVEFEERYDDSENLVYSIKQGNLNSNDEWQTWEECYFDTNGNVIKKNQKYYYGYESVTEVNERIEYIYTSDNVLIEALYYDENGELEKKCVCEKYDSTGKILSEYWNEYKFDYEYRFKYEYDSVGRVITRYQYDSTDKLTHRTDYVHVDGTNYCKAYTYNLWLNDGKNADVFDCELDESTGKLINYKSIWGDENFVGNFYEFDEKGNMIKAERHTNDGEIILLYSAEYDENGILRKECGMDYSNCIDEYEFEREYDEYGNMIRESIVDVWGKETYIYNLKGEVTQQITEDTDGSITIRNYDDNGNLIEYISQDDESNICKIYEYDENNNRIKMESIKNDELDYWEEYIYEKRIISE